MSNTPLTDKHIESIQRELGGRVDVCYARFVRELERKLNDANDEICVLKELLYGND